MVESEAESLTAFKSPVAATDGVCVKLAAPPALTATVSARVVEAPAASGSAFAHVTACATAEHDHPFPTPETKVNPAGRLSVTVMSLVVSAVPTLLILTL